MLRVRVAPAHPAGATSPPAAVAHLRTWAAAVRPHGMTRSRAAAAGDAERTSAVRRRALRPVPGAGPGVRPFRLSTAYQRSVRA